MALRRVSVYTLVKTALENGDLVRPDRCEDCDAHGKIVGHHDDYAKPLDVRWLCYSCHKIWHNNNLPLNDDEMKVLVDFPGPEEMPDLTCEVCGHPTESIPGKVQKTYHKPCRDMRNFLNAAVRAAREIDPKPKGDYIKKIQHEALVASCRIHAIVAKRDALGRFC